MITKSCIIIDDDPGIVDQLTEYIDQFPNLKILGAYTDSEKASAHLLSLSRPIDFLFSDVEMPGLDGFELARRTNGKYLNLILISGHIAYSLEAFYLEAKHFLDKPITLKKFDRLINHVLLHMTTEENFILIRLGGKNKVLKVLHKDIMAIESWSNYLKIYTKTKTYVTYGALHDVAHELEPFKQFIRIRRSFIINIEAIEIVDRYNVTLDNNLHVTVGETYKKEFNTFLAENSGMKK